jgi:hypothetical protein
MRRSLFTIVLCLTALRLHADEDQNQKLAQAEFFEKKIRPMLVEHCYKCHSHDAKAEKGNLRLDTAAGTRAGGDSGPAVVPGRPEESLLLSALKYDAFEMPPSRQLPEHVIQDFRVWIQQGAFDPRQSSPETTPADHSIDIAAGRRFWAFQSPERAQFPDQKTEPQDSDRIDVLVQRQLQQHQLEPNPSASRQHLLRRLTFDLTGLPPTFEQMQQFASDDSADALPSLVDSLLDSPQYGQRWARMWLDVARYAEDQAHIVGGNKELFYPNAWMYRDWLIDAFNADMPYDRFVQLQLAADLLEPSSSEVQPALGFIGLGPKYYRRNNPEVMAEEWEDRVDVVSRGLLGLTAACARCHDHKYDPVRTEDYYALAGVFASTEMYNQPWPALAPAQPVDAESESGSQKKKSQPEKKQPEETLHVVREGKPQDLAVMIRGRVDNRGDVVPRGFLQVLFDGPRREFTKGSGRAELAAAITDHQNPLTARVIVNRIWKEYFGRGLVATPSNFGQLGERPSHPELLDDLAARLMENGWSLKWLHRQIVLSQTWQRASQLNEKAMQQDPANQWLWRVPRRRLSVEAWRDAVLFVSGRLDAETGGPSIQPDNPNETRRTVYAAVSRFELNPLLARFDFPDPNVHAARRVETNTPLQKLFLLNSPFISTSAEHLAARAREESSDSHAEIQRLFELAFQRSPSAVELQTAGEFLQATPDGLNQVAQALLASNEFWYID